MTTATLKRTALNAVHIQMKAKMMDFGGWHLPVYYSGLIHEHHAVRSNAGIFDVSHMGKITIEGPDSLSFLNMVTVNDVGRLVDGQAQYSMICNEEGGILDDVLVYRVSDRSYMMVVNASNREKIWNWLENHLTGGVTLSSMDDQWGLIAVQGPRAQTALDPLFHAALPPLRPFYFARDHSLGFPIIVSRTGYTGEDGVELFVENARIRCVWEQLLSFHCTPCGLGARDTLRLEAALPLYGHELTENLTPLHTHLKWVVKLNKANFIGKDKLLQISRDQVSPALVGIEMNGREIPRHGYSIRQGGRVTSGTFSPTLQRPIALGFMDAHSAQQGESVDINIRGKWCPGTIVPPPFYRRSH